jgi:hypothetical protein
MNYLTPSDLRSRAPATQKLPKSDEKLVDTAAFLRHLEKEHGMRPVLATQGTAHTDVDDPLKSRHLAVASDKSGFAVAILNSHSVWRRAWLGAGFTFGPNYVLGMVVPLRRWRGFVEPLGELLEAKQSLTAAKNVLDAWVIRSEHPIRWMARKMAARAYLEGHRRPKPQALYKDIPLPVSGLAAVLIIQERILKGGLEPEPKDSVSAPRKLKPIIAPDALFNAANATFSVGLQALGKYQDQHFAFPTYREGRTS